MNPVLKWIAGVGLLVLLLWLMVDNRTVTENRRDVDFEEHLKTTMKNYSSWLQKNVLDPTPSKNFTVAGIHNGVCLECEIRNCSMRGHSKAANEIVFAESDLQNNTFLAGRRLENFWQELHGGFNCTGTLRSEFYSELSNDYIFNGHGKFRIAIETSGELLSVENVGITSDYKLNMTHSYSHHTCSRSYALFGESEVWSEDLVGRKYYDDVRRAFASLCMHSMDDDDGSPYSSSRLLHKFLNQIAEEVHLTNIMNEINLPKPVFLEPKLNVTCLEQKEKCNCTTPGAVYSITFNTLVHRICSLLESYFYGYGTFLVGLYLAGYINNACWSAFRHMITVTIYMVPVWLYLRY